MRFLDLLGTTSTKIQLGIAGLFLKSSAGKIRARNAADSADVPLVGSLIASSGDSMELNEDAAGAGADWKYTLQRPAAGMTAAQTLTLPPNAGTAGFALVTDGAGVTTWQAVAGGTDKIITDTTSLAFGSGASVAMYNHPIGAVMERIQVIVDTAFNGTPSVSIGVSGTTSKYAASSSIDLTAAAGTVFDLAPGVVAAVGIEAIIATYAAGGATAGAGRIIVSYSIPS